MLPFLSFESLWRAILVESEAQPTTRPSHSAFIYETPEHVLRLATAEDQTVLSGLLATCSFGSPTPVFEGRGEDFFALRRLQTAQFGEPPMGFIVEDRQGRAVACMSIVVRPSRVGSQCQQVGEICDLRFDPSIRGGEVFPSVLKRALEYVSNWYGVEVFRTSVLGSDFRSLTPWLRRDERRFEQPMGQVMSRMEVAWLPLNLRRLARPTQHVQRASELDRDELIAFLLKSESTRRMGAELSPGQLSRRFATWPTFGIESFQIVRGKNGQIVGCGAPWDPSALRTFRLDRPKFGAKLRRSRPGAVPGRRAPR